MTQEERYQYARALLLAADHIEETGLWPDHGPALSKQLWETYFSSDGMEEVRDALANEADRICPGLRRTT